MEQAYYYRHFAGEMPFKTGHKAEALASRVTYLTGLSWPVNRPRRTCEMLVWLA